MSLAYLSYFLPTPLDDRSLLRSQLPSAYWLRKWCFEQIHSLLLSYSPVNVKGIWIVRQFASAHYHIFRVKGQDTRCHTYFWTEPGRGIPPRVALANKCVNTRRVQIQPGTHRTTHFCHCFLWRPQTHRRINSVASGVIPILEINSLGKLLLVLAVCPFACLEQGNSPVSLSTVCPWCL